MSATEDSDPDWKDTFPRREKSIKQVPDSSFKSRTPLRKFSEKWVKQFEPWLSRYEKNSNEPFCRACQCRLDCNKCHLQRHERTTKHQRNLKIFLEKGEEGALENYKMRLERSKYYQQKKKSTSMLAEIESDFLKEEENAGDYTEDDFEEEETFDFVQTDVNGEQYEEELIPKENKVQIRNSVYKTNAAIVPQKNNLVNTKKERTELFMQIQKDKNDLMNTFKELMKVENNTTTVSPVKEKNHVDLFFESVSSSVKALTPKLIAEAKMRVSQLICELELRSLTENDPNNSAAHVVTPGTIVVSPSSGNSYVLHRTVHQNVSEVEQHQISQDFEALS